MHGSPEDEPDRDRQVRRSLARAAQRSLELRARAPAHDFRSISPRFQGENLEHNLALVERLREIGDAHDATVAQVAIAWVATRGDDVVALVGARRRDRLDEALGALDLQLTVEDLERIEAAVPAGAAAGTRYAESMMRELDSER